MNAVVQAFCLFCVTLGSAPHPQLPRQAGDIWFTHEQLGRNAHLLRLSTTTLIADTDRDRQDRLMAFAHQYASQVCRGRFVLRPAERASWPDVRPIYSRQFIFRCR